jgi:hypothetical protein
MATDQKNSQMGLYRWLVEKSVVRRCLSVYNVLKVTLISVKCIIMGQINLNSFL